MAHLNNKQNKNTNPIICRQDYHLTQPAHQKKNKWTNKNSRQISSYTKLTQTTGSSLVSQFSHLVVSNSCDPMDCSMPGFPVHCQFPEFTQTHVLWVGDAIQPSHLLSPPSLPAFNLSQHQVFSNESVPCIRWPKYWNFSFNISPSNEHPGLISFRMDLFDFLAVQGTLKSLL